MTLLQCFFRLKFQRTCVLCQINNTVRNLSGELHGLLGHHNRLITSTDDTQLAQVSQHLERLQIVPSKSVIRSTNTKEKEAIGKIIQTYLLVVGTVDALRHEHRVEVLVSLQLSALLVSSDHHEYRQMGSEATQILGDAVSGGRSGVLRHHDGGHGGALSEGRGLLGSRVGHALERVLHGGHRAGDQGVGLCVQIISTKYRFIRCRTQNVVTPRVSRQNAINLQNK